MKNLNPKFYIKKLKIGIVCYPSIGGSGIVATQLGSELARLGHRVHFISYDPPFRLKPNQKNIFFHKVALNEYSLFKYPDYTLPLSVKIVEVVKKNKLDILHVHYAVPHATAALLAKNIANEQKIKFPHVITTLHGTDITLLANDKNLMPAIQYSIEASCGVTAVSHALKKDTESVLKLKDNITVIHNFYDPRPVCPPCSVIRKKLRIRDSDFVAVHLSNLRPVKRIGDLLEIMARLKKYPNIKLLILAGGDFKPFEAKVKKLGLSDKIIVQTNILDIEDYIEAADVGLYTSEEESFGMGILETMAYGKPVISTNVGGIPEFMQNGKTGYLFKVSDVAGMAKKLVGLSNDGNLVERLGNNAKIRAAEFSGPKIVKKYLGYYQQIMRECGGTKT